MARTPIDPLEAFVLGLVPPNSSAILPDGMDREPTKDEIRHWLHSLPFGTTFKTNDECGCPLGTYARTKNPDACFRYKLRNAEKAEDVVEPEYWTIRFAAMVDAEPTETITVSRALELLDA